MPPPPTLLNRNPQRFAAAVRQWPGRARLLVEGDSWHQYDGRAPFLWGCSNLFLSVSQRLRCVALVMSSNGDTVENMLGPRVDLQRPERAPPDSPLGLANLRRIRRHLDRRASPMHAIFFSGGGNDVVDHLPDLVRPFERGMSVQECVRQPQVEGQVWALRRGYEALLNVRDQVSPETWVFGHEYGVPNLAKGAFRRLYVITQGPWIKRALAPLGYCPAHSPPTPEQLALMTDLVGHLMGQFVAMLRELSAKPERRFWVGPTRAVLEPAHWRDEMHLTRVGFDTAAATFLPGLRAHLPWALA